MKIKILTLVLSVLCCCAVSAFAQDASLYQKYAKKGDTDAMYNLAGCYWNGTGGVAQDYSSAAFWYEKAAKKNPYAMFMTAYCYLYGIGVPKNYDMSLKYAEYAIDKKENSGSWIKAQLYKAGYFGKNAPGYFGCLLKSAISGYMPAQREMGILRLYGSEEDGVTQDYSSAFKWLKKAAEKEDPESMYYLGLCYECGYGTDINKETSMSYYIKSANAGYPYAEAVVGYACMIGEGVEMDFSKAYDYLKPAADQGNAFAYGKLGDLYYYGLGVTENYNTALEMYKKGAELGDAYSMCEAAYMYGYGIGISEDKSMMYMYYEKAAKMNYAAGQCGLGDCYMNGYGTEKNETSAFYWYKKSAEQENGVALYRLSGCYMEGKGHAKDLNMYIYYLEKAAQAGVTPAMRDLATEYYNGEILQKDLENSIIWFKKAADSNDVMSQVMLGYSYYKGEELVTQKNYEQGFKYLSQAIKNTELNTVPDYLISFVYHCLAGCYRYGRGTEPDQSLASYYTEQAAKYGNSDMKRAANLLRGFRENKPEYTMSSSANDEEISQKFNFTVDAPSNVIETADFKWMVKSVEVKENFTKVYKCVTPKISSSWINSTVAEFIEDAETGQRYYLKSSTIMVSPAKTYLNGTSPKEFTETYPALPATVRYINISSGASYYVKNLKIR